MVIGEREHLPEAATNDPLIIIISSLTESEGELSWNRNQLSSNLTKIYPLLLVTCSGAATSRRSERPMWGSKVKCRFSRRERSGSRDRCWEQLRCWTVSGDTSPTFIPRGTRHPGRRRQIDGRSIVWRTSRPPREEAAVSGEGVGAAGEEEVEEEVEEEEDEEEVVVVLVAAAVVQEEGPRTCNKLRGRRRRRRCPRHDVTWIS